MGAKSYFKVPLEVFNCFNVVGINVQSRLCYQVHMLHGTAEIRSEAFDKNRSIPAEGKTTHKEYVLAPAIPYFPIIGTYAYISTGRKWMPKLKTTLNKG